MTFAKRHLQIAILCLATVYLFVSGVYSIYHSPPGTPAAQDFIPVYSGARCLLYGCNPYRNSDIQNQFLKAGAPVSGIPDWSQETPVYPPSTLLVVSPLAPLPYTTARLLWIVVNAAAITTAVWMIWLLALPEFSWVSTFLAAIYLVIGHSMLAVGQPSGIAIALLAIALVLFLKGRHPGVASIALLLSLAVKPQIGGLVALYLLWQRIHWRHVLIAMAGSAMALLVGIGILQMHSASQSWSTDWRGQMASSLLPGAINDPRPEYYRSIYDLNLDALTSVASRDAHVFQPASLILFTLLLALWFFLVRRGARAGTLDHSLSLSALSVLTLLPVYHRSYDTYLLLITVLAVPQVFRAGVLLGAAVFALQRIVSTAAYVIFLSKVLVLIPLDSLAHRPLLFLLLMRERPLILLLQLGVFLYLLAFRHLPNDYRSARIPLQSAVA